MIPRTTIDAIREKTDIVELIESKGVSLKRTGSRYVGLCPVHTERTPSFNVDENSQTYHCFGCGIGGDAFAFMIEVDAYTFSGAVEALGDMAGVEVIDSAGEDPDYLRKKEYLRCVSSAAWFYRQKFSELPNNHPAKEDLDKKRNYLYVEGRETWLEDFGMGYAPGSGNVLIHFLRSQGYTDDQIFEGGLAFQNDRTGQLVDRFRNRLMWEIRDIKGQVIGFSGRALSEDAKPKYLNTSDTVLYSKSKVLFGIDLARKKMAQDKTCIVVEGAADAMAVSATGATNVVASCGTAFGSEHAAIIRRIIDDFDSKNNGKFIFLFDGDEAGIKATKKMFYDIKPSIKDRSYVASLDNLDPVDFRVQYGDKALLKALSNPVPITEFILNQTAMKYNMSEIESRSAFTREAMQVISHISEPDIFDAYKRKISAMSGVSMNHLRGERGVDRENVDNQQYSMDPYLSEYDDAPPDAPADPFAGLDGQESAPQRDKPLERISRLLVASMLQFPDQTFAALKDKGSILRHFEDEELKRLLQEGMINTGNKSLKGESGRLTVNDFTNSLMATEFFHIPLNTEEDRVESFVNRLAKNMDEIVERKKAEEFRTKIATHEISEEDALRALIAKRANKSTK